MNFEHSTSQATPLTPLAKSRTGIQGLDEITGGGLPLGRPTLVCGSAGCGKTLLATEFLVRGARDLGEPGVFITFEETAAELTRNVASLGFDLDALVRDKKLVIDHVHIERSEIEESGDYNLDGLFVRLNYAIDTIGARRVVLDTLEALFSGFPTQTILRSELQRLFRWLKETGVTAVITAEQGDRTLTRHGLEEYVADCVILLDHRIIDQNSTRRLRVVKYRGALHGTNEYPFLIDEQGISVLPVTSLSLDYAVSTERISSGIPRLDTMLGNGGFYRGSSILISGTAGTGKTSIAAAFVESTCRAGERCLYVSSEESPRQLIRNARSIGIDLEPWVEQGLLRFYAIRPTMCGLEMHLVALHKQVAQFEPGVVIIDPVTNFTAVGSPHDVKLMLTRLTDFFKERLITSLFTSLTSGSFLEQTDIGISSLMDVWLLLRDLEANGERNRGLYVLKARGMGHSNQIREFLLSDEGIQLLDVYVGQGNVLTGSSRALQEARDTAEATAHRQERERKRAELERKRQVIAAQMAALRAELEECELDLTATDRNELLREHLASETRDDLARLRKAD